MKVRGCEELKNIFSFSSPRCLPQLQKIEVIECYNMEEIFAIEREDDGNNNELSDAIELRQIHFLTLKSLPALIHLSHVKAPSELQNRQTEFTTDTFSNEIILEEELDTPISLFNEQVVFPNLEVLALSEISFQRIWPNKLPSTSCYVQNLSRLIVQDCDYLKCVFSPSMVRNLVQLQHLEICNCTFLEEIVFKEEAEVAARFVFPRVTSLKLCELPELKSFYPGLHTSEWPALKKLEVYDCYKIKIFTSELFSFRETFEEGHLNIPAQQPLFLVEKIFPNLEELALNGKDIKMIWQGEFPEHLFVKLKVLAVVDDESDAFPLGLIQRFYSLEKLELNRSSYTQIFSDEEAGNITQLKSLTVEECHILHNLEPSSTSFQNLTTLGVWRCDGLVNLVSPSTAKSLVQLAEMRIYGCRSMTEIVAEEADVGDVIVFKKLKRLSLERLKRLTSFCSANYNFTFPSLKYLIVRKCPNMKTFTGGVVITPKLQTVEDDRTIDVKCWEHDLNTIIQHLQENMAEESRVDDEEESEMSMSEETYEEEDEEGSEEEEEEDDDDDDDDDD